MATLTSASLAAPESSAGSTESKRQSGMIFEIKDFFRQFIVAAFDPYRPEVHYMRGPGPACRAKRRAQS